MKPENLVTAGLFNYNGMRNAVFGIGRLQITLDSLIENVPLIKTIRFILVDNHSSDESKEVLFSFPFGEKHTFNRVVDGSNWFSTSRNNLENLRRILSMVKTRYYWNIENDSYFFNPNDLVSKAVFALEENPDISIIHLRRWTPLDCQDKPGAPQNHTRVEEIRKYGNGILYVLERTQDYAVWVPVGDGIKEDFVPFEDDGKFNTLC